MSVKLEPHNSKAYDEVKKIYEEDNMAAVVHPTGTGKSYIALKLIEDNQGKKVVYLAPLKSILHQIKDDMIKNGIRFNDGTNKLVQRYTYQKLTRMFKNDELNLDADIIILDEFHHCGAPEWGQAVEELLEQNPNAKVLGLSATPMRYFDESVRDMAEELFGNSIASEMTFEEAIDQGILPEPIYTTGIYDASEIKREYEEKVENCPSDETKKIARDILTELNVALDNSVKGLPELLENNMTNKSGKYIVYCKNIEDMQKKISDVNKIFGKVNSQIEVYSVSSMKYDDEKNAVSINDIQNRRQIRNFENSSNNGNLKLLFSVDMINEGYHFNGIDGVVMMRPTSSPTLFSQQLGRALSIGSDKQPIVIDLVNNADSIRIIENFHKQLRERKQDEKRSVLRGISVSEETRNISEIMRKIDNLVKRRSNLSNEEKLDLMVEYLKSIEETDEEFTSDTVYKGFNIGHMRNNLRSAYWNGTLKIDEETLEKFKKIGIIIEKPTRIRTSTQEKYDFLISMIGKNKEELKHAKMESGLTYYGARSSIQYLYNAGELDLTQEQIEVLKRNRIINLSSHELEDAEKRYDIPQKHIKKIWKEYGSFDDFMEKYKRREVEYDFGKDIFVGGRCIALSEKDITVMQKLRYCKLCEAFGLDFFVYRYYEKDINYMNSYINVDEIDRALNELSEKEQKALKLRYGLYDGNTRTLEEMGKEFNVTGERFRQIEAKAIRKVRASERFKNFVILGDNIQEINEEMNKIKEREDDIYNLEKLLIYYNENPNNQDVTFKKLGIHFNDRVLEKFIESESDYMIHTLIKSELKQYYWDLGDNKKEMLELRKNRHIEFMDIFETLKREYLNNEDIFNPNYIIKGRKIKEIKNIQDVPKKHSIKELPVKFITLVYLHHFGIHSIEDLSNKVETIEEIENILNSIKGIVEDDKEKIVKYILDKKNNCKESVEHVTTLEELDLSARSYNCLKKGAGINDLSELLEKFESLKDLKRVKNMGRKSLDEIIDKVHSLGYKFKFEIEPDQKQEKIEQKDISLLALDEIAISDLGLSVRSYNCLNRAGINDLSELLENFESLDDLKRVRNLGRKSLDEIIDKVHSLGYKFKFEIEEEQEKDEESNSATDPDNEKENLIETILEQQEKIKSQQVEILELKNKRRNLDEQ